MKTFWQSVRLHLITSICFLVYITYYVLQIRTIFHFRAAIEKVNPGERLAWGEGVMYGYLFISLLGGVFLLAIILRAILYKGNINYYAYLGLIVAASVALLWKL